jgi:hypothetical protein
MPAPLCFSVTDHGIFLGTTDGVFQSLDGGLHWWPAGLRGQMVTSLVQSGQAEIFAGTVGAGLYQQDLTGIPARSPARACVWADLAFGST